MDTQGHFVVVQRVLVKGQLGNNMKHFLEHTGASWFQKPRSHPGAWLCGEGRSLSPTLSLCAQVVGRMVMVDGRRHTDWERIGSLGDEEQVVQM